MKKKIIFIIILVILFLLFIGIYNLSNHSEENEITNNIITENVLENEQENSGETTNSNTANSSITETGANTSSDQDIEKKEVAHVSPSGFMGSSLYRVILYSNGEVYVQTFDGNGYEKENIISEELIAQNVEAIREAEDEEHYGEVILEGGEKLNNNFGWITLE